MDLIQIYECFCDRTRLRILNLLMQTPLCVCHFQDVLREPQVKISKHLAYLRARHMVETRQEKNWVIYSLSRKRSAELKKNLRCLAECTQRDHTFKMDLRRLEKLRASCCEPAAVFAAARED